MLLFLAIPPGGPDLCALTGYCPVVQTGTEPNMLFLASTLVLAGIVLSRNPGRRK